MIESQVERYLHSKVTANYGMCLKFVSPGTAGVPDRIVLHRGRTMFVELKRPGGKPRLLQQEIARMMSAAGAMVYCISTTDQVDRFVNELNKITCYPDPGDYDEI